MLQPSCTMLSPGREGRDLQQNFLDVTVPPSFSNFSYLIKHNVILGLKKKKKAQRIDSVNTVRLLEGQETVCILPEPESAFLGVS